ncbi:P-loop containing nucleoside triphosphate hydrolase protein [Coemansia mojavensis]|nr:P-loop containing nucleoside triphosphate hydrolase protein [Coemansia mojavensis]
MGPRAKVNPTLGKSIIRKRFEGKRRPTEKDTELHTVDLDDGPAWTKLQSITQQGDLDEFLHTAELAGTEFTAERMNVKIISTKQTANPYLLTAAEEEKTLERHRENRSRLKIPRRPEWDRTTTAAQLHRSEREAFMEWRRELARLQEDEGLLLTPFERNLEVWRQLWRVLERSHLVVQIVDARNPLLFRSEDLERYVKEIDENKRTLLLVNKADMLTGRQREAWAEYFGEHGIRHLFFSAKESNEQLQQEREQAEAEQLAQELTRHTLTDEQLDEQLDGQLGEQLGEAAREERRQEEAPQKPDFEAQVRAVELSADQLRTRVLTPAELVAVLMRESPETAAQGRVVIGLVGYPNVGKSSTINAVVGSKRVNVGAMPGKTKHFQTIHLTDSVVLCDCPGLVFPTFATTAADMVCNGVLPIDQLREFSGPSALVARRIPKHVLEAVYGIAIPTRPLDAGGDGVPTAEELLCAYAAARGLFKSGEGNPDESRAARVLLKDYVAGKLVYCHAPPSWPCDAPFNAEHHDLAALAARSRHVVADPAAPGEFSVKHAASDRRNAQRAVRSNAPLASLDRQFFAPASGAALQHAQRRGKSHQVTQGRGYAQMLGNGIAARALVNDRGEPISAAAAAAAAAPAKHSKRHKKRRPAKQRSGAGVFEDL